MYGMQGNFGGMPYQSPGASLAGGIEAGIGIVQNARALEQQTADRAQARQDMLNQQQITNDRADRELNMKEAAEAMTQRRNDSAEQRQMISDAQSGIEGEAEQLRQVGQEHLAAAGGKPENIAPDVFAADQAKWADLNKRKTAINQARGGAFLQAQMGIAQDTMKQITTDPTYLDNPANADKIVHALTLNTHMDPANFLPGPGGQSNFEMQRDDFHKGFSTGDTALVGKAVGNIFKPQLEAGRLGMYDPLGGIVDDVSLHGTQPFVTTPDSKAAHPVLSITASHPDGSVSTQPAAFPAAAGFAHDDNQEGHAVTPSTLLDHMGNLGNIQAIVNAHPGLQQYIRDHANNPNPITQDAAAFYTMLGAKADHSTLEKLGENERYVSVPRDAQGQPTGPPVEVMAPVPAAQRKGGGAETAANRKLDYGQALLGHPHLRPDEEGPGNYTADEINGIQSGIMPKPHQPQPGEQRVQGDAAASTVFTAHNFTFDDTLKAWRPPEHMSAADEASVRMAAETARTKAMTTGPGSPKAAPGIQANAVTQIGADNAPQHPALPRDPNSRSMNTTYQTPSGPMYWDGKGLIRGEAPAKAGI